MNLTEITAEDLKKLPLRAIVAFAARCARRVERIAGLPDDHPERTRCHEAVAAGIRLAEDVARGLPCPTADLAVREVEACREFVQGDRAREDAYSAVVRACHAAVTALHAVELREEPAEHRLVSGGPAIDPASHVADVSSDLAALGAHTAAIDAADALGHTDGFSTAAGSDYHKLLGLNLGEYPEAGAPIDPSPEGPLGPLGPARAGQ